jgi:hypothetical protein
MVTQNEFLEKHFTSLGHSGLLRRRYEEVAEEAQALGISADMAWGFYYSSQASSPRPAIDCECDLGKICDRPWCVEQREAEMAQFRPISFQRRAGR